MSWVPGEMDQAINRIHRIGIAEDVETVKAYILHVPGTLESAVLNVHDGKNRVIDRLMGVA